MKNLRTLKANIEIRERQARKRAGLVLQALKERHVDAVIFGSLASRKFDLDSDVDFLVRACPRQLKYRIESLVEDLMEDIPFDVVYRDEVPAPKLSRMEAATLELEEVGIADA
jgi:predicted nucleotidyltransferase